MSNDEFLRLNTGDIVRGKISDISYVVMTNYRTHVMAIKVADIINPSEWTLVAKAELKDVQEELL